MPYLPDTYPEGPTRDMAEYEEIRATEARELARRVGEGLPEAVEAVWVTEHEVWIDEDWGAPTDGWVRHIRVHVTVGYRAGTEDQARHLRLAWDHLEGELPGDLGGHLVTYRLVDLDGEEAPQTLPNWVNPDHAEDDPLDYGDVFEQDLHHPHNHHQRGTGRLTPGV